MPEPGPSRPAAPRGPVKAPRAFEIIRKQIRKEFASGTLRAGDKLPPERELAAQFHVSHSALREALRSLEVAGIIRNMKGAKGGAFVHSADPDWIAAAMPPRQRSPPNSNSNGWRPPSPLLHPRSCATTPADLWSALDERRG